MKKLMTIALLAAIPAAAQAMGMHGGMGGGMGMHGAMRFGPPPMGLHFAVVLYALLAALGYWVLSHAAKETENCVRRTGKTVAWTLIVTGLLGLLCGVMAHIKMNCPCSSKCGGEEVTVTETAGDQPGQRNIQVQVKTEKPADKKK